jgi:kynurenine formamidase
MPISNLHQLLSLAGAAQIFDLSMDLFTGMPHYPTHPPFVFGLTKRHGEVCTRLPDGRLVSSSAESIAVGTHVGTHIDGLGHFSCNGMIFGDVSAAEQSYTGGLPRHGIETMTPMLRRGVMLDIPRLENVTVLAKDFAIKPEHLEHACEQQSVEVRPKDVVLIRTGWAQHWPDPVTYVMGGEGSVPTSPGPELEAARWLSERQVFAAGSDTLVFERSPSPLPVHVHLLVEKGIHIMEALNLEELSAKGISEFLFVAAPLRIRGATGSPIRPVAVLV